MITQLDIRQCPEMTAFKEKGQPRWNQTEVCLLTSLSAFFFFTAGLIFTKIYTLVGCLWRLSNSFGFLSKVLSVSVHLFRFFTFRCVLVSGDNRSQLLFTGHP